MKKLINILVLVLLFSVKTYGQSEKCDLQGIWLTNNKTLKIEFYKPNDTYQAKVIWKSEDADSDVNVGDIIIKGLKYNSSKNKYEDGTLRAKGTKLDCEILCANANEIEILMWIGFIKVKKDVVWTRVKN